MGVMDVDGVTAKGYPNKGEFNRNVKTEDQTYWNADYKGRDTP